MDSVSIICPISPKSLVLFVFFFFVEDVQTLHLLRLQGSRLRPTLPMRKLPFWSSQGVQISRNVANFTSILPQFHLQFLSNPTKGLSRRLQKVMRRLQKAHQRLCVPLPESRLGPPPLLQKPQQKLQNQRRGVQSPQRSPREVLVVLQKEHQWRNTQRQRLVLHFRMREVPCSRGLYRPNGLGGIAQEPRRLRHRWCHGPEPGASLGSASEEGESGIS